MLENLSHSILGFIVVITAVVFIHELGHYLLARFFGVQVEVFSIGMGKKLFGWRDKRGTSWQVGLFPIGGYVKMYGDATPASTTDYALIEAMETTEKAKTFAMKKLWQKFLIVLAGPLANFLLTLAIFTAILLKFGTYAPLPVITHVAEESPAAVAGLRIEDRILQINNKTVTTFRDIELTMAINQGEDVAMLVERNGEQKLVYIKPKLISSKDQITNKQKRYYLGIGSNQIEHREFTMLAAIGKASKDMVEFTNMMFSVIKQMIVGSRSTNELGSVISIAKHSGQSVDLGFWATLNFIAVLSLNLGVMNLLPIPLLDGGHLFLYIIEAVRRKPLPARAYQAIHQASWFLLIGLMIFLIINDFNNIIFVS